MGSRKDFEAKIVMLGDTTVGKSTLIDCLINGPRGLSEDGLPTTRAPDNVYHNFEFNERVIKTNIWDTVGQEKYKSMNKQFYNKAHGALLVADISGYTNEDNLHFWVQDIQKVAGTKVCIILTGNKADKEPNQASVEILKRFAEEYNMPFCMTSAALGTNVTETMDLLVNMIAEKFLVNGAGGDGENDDDEEEEEIEDLKRTVISVSSHTKNNKDKQKCCLGC